MTKEEAKQKRERKEVLQRRQSARIWKRYILPSIVPAIVSIAFFIFSNYGASMLTNVSPTWGYILFLSSTSIVLGWWVWKVIGWILRKNHFATLTRAISVCSVVLAIMITSPYYIGYFVKAQGSIEMPTFVDDSTQVLVHYGRRPNDIFWTQKTVGELKQNPSIALKVNDQDIFNIHIEGNKLYVDAIVFAGYGEQTVPGYTTIGSLDKFSIQISGYLNTDNSSVGKSFSSKTQATMIKNKALAQPVVIKNNAFSRKPNGWEIQQNSMALEITNENNIPVLILKYKSPCEITISGLFVTSFGILKVDNSEDVVFEFGDSLSELNAYKVDRIFIHSIFDFFKPERTYILHN